MPKISGFEVLKAISVDPRINTIPILMLTNLAQESDMEKAKQLGAREYLVKVKNSVDAIVAKIKALV
jgi:CheY-like chemotaxis protein